MMDFMGPTGMMQGGAAGFSGPSVSIMSASFAGGYLTGFIRSGGYTASTIGASGGSLSATILTGFVTDSVTYIPDTSEISISIVGDAVAALAGVSAITVGGVPCAVSYSPYYDAVKSVTLAPHSPSKSLISLS
mgnify:CR=1 FL=1